MFMEHSAAPNICRAADDVEDTLPYPMGWQNAITDAEGYRLLARQTGRMARKTAENEPAITPNRR